MHRAPCRLWIGDKWSDQDRRRDLWHNRGVSGVNRLGAQPATSRCW